MFFAVAFVIVVVLPLAATAVAYARAQREVSGEYAGAVPPRARRKAVGPLESGFSAGVMLIVLMPCLLGFIHHAAWTYPAVVLGLAGVALVAYLLNRERHRYALGLALGVGAIGIAAPAAFFLVFWALDLVF